MKIQAFFSVEPEFFKVFNSYHWIAGNEAVLNEPNSVVLSKSQAKKYFGDWQNALGKTLIIDNGITAKVNGILEDVPKNTDLPLTVLVSFKTLKSNGSNYGYN